MDYTKRLLAHLQQRINVYYRFPKGRPNALENSILARLPTELMQQITNALPVASAVSFSLSCRQIYHLIGTRHIENLATSSQETLAFLEIIEHDLLDQITCIPCEKLHKIRNAIEYTEYAHTVYTGKVPPKCLSHDRRVYVTSFIHDNFSTAVFKMVMKHYRLLGHDSRLCRLLKLLSGEYRAYTNLTLAVGEKAECQIKDGSLFTCQRVSFRGTYANFEYDFIHYWICPHLEIESAMRSTSLSIQASRPLPPEEKWSIYLECKKRTAMNKILLDLCSGRQQCVYCQTVYQARFKHDSARKMKFEITIWKGLGQGPETAEWKAQFPLQNHRSIPQSVKFIGGEIAAVF